MGRGGSSIAQALLFVQTQLNKIKILFSLKEVKNDLYVWGVLSPHGFANLPTPAAASIAATAVTSAVTAMSMMPTSCAADTKSYQ